MNGIASSTSFPLPQLSLTAQSAGHPQPVYVGLNLVNGWVKVWNESPFQLQASDGAGAWMHEVPAQAVDAFPLDPGVKFFTLLPIGLIPLLSPAYKVRLALFPDGPPPGSYPQALSRQAASVGPSGQTGFAATLSFSAPTVGPSINVFNPLNSGVIFTFFTLQGENGGTSVFTFTIAGNNSGVNTAETNSLTPISHNLANSVASNAIVSWSQTANFFSVGDIRSKYAGPGLTADFLTAPS